MVKGPADAEPLCPTVEATTGAILPVDEALMDQR
jgi:hypothetical protein